MRKTIFVLSGLFLALGVTAFRMLPAYQLFDRDGNIVAYEELLATAAEADVVLFGELHNNSMVHWLQRQLTEDLAHGQRPLVLGAEMFETDDQLLLDEFLGGVILEKDFEKESKLWPNYATDYKPMVTTAKEEGLPFIGTNVPRRYAALVSRQGLEALNDLPTEAQALCAPLPITIDYELPSYKAMIEMMGDHMGGMDPRFFVQAQALKDATMADRILAYWEPGTTFLHYNGTYHSKDFEGISWYLKQTNPDLKIVTIHSVEQASLAQCEEEYKGTAHFVLAVPENMSKSY
ncbi:MAG TPA: iron-regulated protein [Cytophagales bacterium]|nr:iron-regulated protein [Cytophagales bacterium]HAA17531.1 iron-regulated protein [Cytophagales bacterium]HAP59441.1 iron-regulated protein [Cytophagales bacterium]